MCVRVIVGKGKHDIRHTHTHTKKNVDVVVVAVEVVVQLHPNPCHRQRQVELGRQMQGLGEQVHQVQRQQEAHGRQRGHQIRQQLR